MPLTTIWRPLSIVLALTACHRPTTPENLAPSNLPAAPRYVGRFVPDGAAVRFAWGLSTITARFSGTRVALRLQDVQVAGRSNLYNVSIDGRPPVVLSMAPGQVVYPVAQDLSAGEHSIRVIKRTEALVGEARFAGFELGEGHLLSPPAPRRRTLEFIGDSITAGYGNEGAEATCQFSAATENGAATYAALTADALDADAVVLAWSGKGVWRNRDDTMTDTMPIVSRRALPNDPNSTWDAQQGIPDAVIINLGTNDFGPGVPDAAQFAAAYAKLIQDIRQRAPRALIVCTLGPMLSDEHPKDAHHLSIARTYLQRIVQDARDANVRFLEFPVQTAAQGFGCDYHPTKKTHAAMAAQLTDVLGAILK